MRDFLLSLLFMRTYRFPLSFRFGPSARCCNTLRTMASADSCGFSRASRLWLRNDFALRRPPQIRTSSFRPRLPKFTAAAFGSSGFRLVAETHPTATASNWIRVPQAVLLPPASFRSCLAAGTLALGYGRRLPAPIPDFHRIDDAHAGRTIKKPMN